jgi:hypothetical protein
MFSGWNDILQLVSRDAAEKQGPSQARGLRALHDNQLHPHRYPQNAILQIVTTYNTVDEIFSQNIVLEEGACFTSQDEFNSNRIHLWSRNNLHAIGECAIKFSSLSASQ